MFSPKFNKSKSFRPALQYLLSSNRPNHKPSASIGSIDSDEDRMQGSASANPQASSLPLMAFSRTLEGDISGDHTLGADSLGDNTSDGSDGEYNQWGIPALRPFLPPAHEAGSPTDVKRLLYGEGLGAWLFTTRGGWQVYIGVLLLVLGWSTVGLDVLNRVIIWGDYLRENYTHRTELFPLISRARRFPVPLMTVWLELMIAHGLLILLASFTRLISPALVRAGCSGIIAPSQPWPAEKALPGPALRAVGAEMLPLGPDLATDHETVIGASKSRPLWTRLSCNSAGIAGGGFFEFERAVQRQTAPVVALYTLFNILNTELYAKVSVFNFSVLQLCIVPMALYSTRKLDRHSTTTICSVATATVALAILVSSRIDRDLALGMYIVAGLEVVCAVCYPMQIQSVYKNLLASLAGSADGTHVISSSAIDASGTPSEARAFWRLLHYTSLQSIIVLTPIALLFGEPLTMWRNWSTFDPFFHWFMILIGGVGTWAVFFSTVALTRATSPLTTIFVLNVPTTAFLLPLMARFRLEIYEWTAYSVCWFACGMFVWGRVRDGRARWR